MLRIEMPRHELTISPEVTVGNRNRYSTATGVAFINENLLISAAFNNKMLYLIELLENEHKIIHQLKTKHNPDLLKYKDEIILTSDYPYMQSAGHASIYKIIDKTIVFKKEIMLANTKAHGAEIIDENNIIITSNSDHNRGLLYIDINSGIILKNFNKFKHYPKDVAIKDEYLFVVTAESLPQIGKTTVIKESILYVFNKTSFEKIDEITFYGQTDSLTIIGKDIFITVQGDDTIVHFKFIDDKLFIMERINGFNFPHGIASYSGRIAVTNYGDNTIRIFELSELISI